MNAPLAALALSLSVAASAAAGNVNPGPIYQVDPGWPHRPADVTWAAVPSVAVDGQDNVWVFIRKNPVVQIYSRDGTFLRSWHEDNPHASAHAIRFDRAGNVWLVDVGLNVVRQYTREGRLLLTLGTLGVAGEDDRHFFRPTDVAFAPDGGIFVTDGYGNSRVVAFDGRGRYVRAWGRRGSGPGEFNCPHSIVSDSHGRLYVADRNNGRIQVFNTEGRLLHIWANLLVPWGFWISAADDIWVCGSSPDGWVGDQKYLGVPPKDQVLMKFNTEGKLLQLWTVPKGRDGAEKPGELNWVHGIALDSHGDIYAGDILGKRVQKFVRK